MLEAMWSLNFISNQEMAGRQMAGNGIVVLETGRIMGGDSSYMYIGSYEMIHGKAHAQVKVTKYAPGITSIFGDISEFSLTLEGEPQHDDWILSGYVTENPAQRIAVRLTRQAELP